jgi:alkanesulfonate monooxygenase SsuD/methylene tetrahydromethanopterin reductase-like flavin-dependent oxidoreductase (luciferase family)
MPERFAPLVNLYRESARRAGHDPAKLPVGINTQAFVADTSQEAANAFFPAYAEAMSRIGRERGWPPTTRQQFDASITPRGALAVGSPQQVIEKILFQHEVFRHDRYLAQLAVGTMPHRQMMRAIELMGGTVAPAVRKALGAKAVVPAGAIPDR